MPSALILTIPQAHLVKTILQNPYFLDLGPEQALERWRDITAYSIKYPYGDWPLLAKELSKKGHPHGCGHVPSWASGELEGEWLYGKTGTVEQGLWIVYRAIWAGERGGGLPDQVWAHVDHVPPHWHWDWWRWSATPGRKLLVLPKCSLLMILYFHLLLISTHNPEGGPIG